LSKLVKGKGKRKFRTGQCMAGWHEGTKARDSKGNPAPTCRDFEHCPCPCHAEIDEIFRIAKLDRVLQENSEYRLPRRTYWMPGDDTDDVDAPFITGGTLASESTSEPRAERLTPVTTPSNDRTPTGRRHKGDLEIQVLLVCYEWTGDKYEWEQCTPKLVAEAIGRIHAVEPPSTGAVQAVWDRWVRLSFATYDKKPVRFGKFLVDDPSLATLDKIKLVDKQSRRRARSAERRGYRT